MKALKAALRFSTLFRTLPNFKPKVNNYTLAVTGLTTSYALYFATNKILT
jgi:hypothetical protein